MDVTKNLARYVNERAINLSALANRINVPPQALYDSLGKNGTRKIKADELLAICADLGLNPMDFK